MSKKTGFADNYVASDVATPGISEQPMPPKGKGLSVQELVRRDLEEREKVGIERYRTALYPHNGRNALLDAYQECLDMACYLRQALEEQK